MFSAADYVHLIPEPVMTLAHACQIRAGLICEGVSYASIYSIMVLASWQV